MVRRADGAVERLASGGIILTMLPDAAYSTEDIHFASGDRLLLFTDGLLEAARGDDEFFGDRQLARVVAETPASSNLSAAVLRAHREWIGPSASVSDDVTLVVVEAVAAPG
jgi:phosphoserine phosphatase RsbU/P